MGCKNGCAAASVEKSEKYLHAPLGEIGVGDAAVCHPALSGRTRLCITNSIKKPEGTYNLPMKNF